MNTGAIPIRWTRTGSNLTQREWKNSVTRDCTGQFDIRFGMNVVPNVKPLRAVVFVSGRNEWIEKYDFLPSLLPLRPDTVYLSWDHRGQGQSGGDLANVSTYDHYAKDVQVVLKASGIEALPYVMICHSMGSLIALYSYMKGYINPKALVLCSPLLELPNQPVPRHLARPISKLATLIGMGSLSTLADKHRHRPFKFNKLTHDKEIYKRNLKSDKPNSGARFEWVRRTFEAIDYVYAAANLKKLKIPVYIQAAGKESVVDNIGLKNWCSRAEHYADTEITATVIPGALHELFSEAEQYRKPALENVRKWVGKYL